MSSDPSRTPDTLEADSANGRGVDPLERLRDRVERAATEIERLRRENAELARRVQTLSQEELFASAEVGNDLALSLDEDPDVLREKIASFIEALDRVIAERSATRQADSDSPDDRQ